jgi:hypothetical protein
MQTDNLTVKNSSSFNMKITDNSVIRFFNSKVQAGSETNFHINSGSRAVVIGSVITDSSGDSVNLYDRASLEVRSTGNSFTGTIACSNPANMGVSIVINGTGSSWDNSSSPTTCPVH